MKVNKLNPNFNFILIIGLIVCSCSKLTPRKIAGDYACTVDYRYWEITPVNIDSTWTENITVEKEKRNIIIFNKIIPIDCLKTDGYYEEGFYSSGGFYSLEVGEGTLIYSRSGGGLGGGSSHRYDCQKID